MTTGCIHGRFQPPHNGHMHSILLALDRCSHLFIGICTPTICSEAEALHSGYPCTLEQNPFSYADRVRMITASLVEAGVSLNRFSCIPFPSDYVAIPNSITHDTVFYLSTTSPADDAKAEHLRSLGYFVEMLLTIPSGAARTRGAAIRESLRSGTNTWKESVPSAVAQIIEKTQ